MSTYWQILLADLTMLPVGLLAMGVVALAARYKHKPTQRTPPVVRHGGRCWTCGEALECCPTCKAPLPVTIGGTTTSGRASEHEHERAMEKASEALRDKGAPR